MVERRAGIHPLPPVDGEQLGDEVLGVSLSSDRVELELELESVVYLELEFESVV